MEGPATDRDRVLKGSLFDEIRVPDVAEEILGWKVLAVGEEGRLSHHVDHMHHIVVPTGLSSPTRYAHWPPHDWLRATCRRDAEHRPPVEGCTCGIYAVAEPSRATPYMRKAPLTVLARVGLAGKVIPATRGWRAENARVVALTATALGRREYPGLFAQVARRYDVPILDLDLRGTAIEPEG